MVLLPSPHFIQTSTRLLHYLFWGHVVCSVVYIKTRVGIHVETTIAYMLDVRAYTIAGNNPHIAPCRGLLSKSAFAHIVVPRKNDNAVPTIKRAPKIAIILLIVRKSFKRPNRSLNFSDYFHPSNIMGTNCFLTLVKRHPSQSRNFSLLAGRQLLC